MGFETNLDYLPAIAQVDLRSGEPSIFEAGKRGVKSIRMIQINAYTWFEIEADDGARACHCLSEVKCFVWADQDEPSSTRTIAVPARILRSLRAAERYLEDES